MRARCVSPLRSLTGAALALCLAVGVLTTVGVGAAVAAGTMPYEPGAVVDTFPQINGVALPSSDSLASSELTTAGTADPASPTSQRLPSSATASVAALGKGWQSAGTSPLSVRAGQTIESGQTSVAGADAVGDTVRVDLNQLNGLDGSASAEKTSSGTLALQVALQTTQDAKAGGPNNDIDVRLSYAKFANVYGGSWSDRLMVTAFPACSVTTPKDPACQVGVPVPSANDGGAQTLAFTATPPLQAGEAPPTAPSSEVLRNCLTDANSSASAGATWEVDPTNQDDGDNPDTDAAAVSGDDGNYDDADLADDPYNDLDDSTAAQQAPAAAVKPAPELTATASDATGCRGLVYEVRAGVGGYGMATAASAGGSDSVPSTLEGSADWQVGEGSGEFNWSYPIAMPTGQADEAPQLNLSYSSAVADGMTGPSTAQASQVGLGWTLEPGHISRSYAACGDDDESDATGNLCWRTESGNLVDDLSLVLNGHATRLIRGSNNKLRLQDDPGWQVDTYNGPGSWATEPGAPALDNADGDDEAFRLISPDGTKYYFGFGTKSVWTVPVRADEVGEPCFRVGGSITDAECVQGWQWNLDRVVDADGNRVKYTYETETNYYKYNGTDVLPYDRSGYLTSIRYGFPRPTPAPATESVEPQAAVEFVMAGRCNASILGDGNDDADVPCNEANPSDFRDVPKDLICGPSSGAGCKNPSPSFFSMKRYKRIITHRGKLTTPGEALSGPVTDRYVLRHSMVDPDDSGADEPDLWLDQIAHQPTPAQSGQPDTAVALPTVNFKGDFFDNLVVGEGGGKELQKRRLVGIRNELGGRVLVEYGHQRPCAPADVPMGKTAFSSTKDCFTPRRPNGRTTNFTWYHKYLVKTLTLGDQSLALQNLPNGDPSLGTIRQYKYTYRGNPGWRYDGSSKNVPAKYRSWSDWRGYQTTLIRTMGVDKQTNPGVPQNTAKSVRRVVVYRGLYNSRRNYSTTALRTTIADGGFVSTVERGLGSAALPDRNALRGKAAEEVLLEPPAGDCESNCVATWISRTYHGYTIYRSALNNLNLAAYFTGEDLTRTHTRVTRETGSKLSWDRRHTINRTFDTGGAGHQGLALGTVTEVLDRGAGTSDNKGGDRNHCTRTTWAGNTDKWLRVPTKAEVYDQTPTAECSDAAARLLSRTANFYDDETQTGSLLTRGRLTKVNTYTDDTSFITTKTGYDKYGRVVSTLDGRGFPISTSYNQSEDGETVDDLPVKILTNTNQSQTVTRLDKRRGLPISVTDYGDAGTSVDDAVTTTTYDGYGRVISVRSPNLQGAGGQPSIRYFYDVNKEPGKPARVRTTTRRDDSTFDTSYAYMDGWGRTIETQTLQADGTGRVVSATAYNELGQPYISMPVIANGSAPGSGLLNAKKASVERHELTTYDAASRVTRVWHMAKNDVQKYSTFIKPQGDRSVTTQPVVGATVEFVDGWGRTSKVQQYANDGVDVSANREHSATYGYDGTNNLTTITSTIAGTDQTWEYTYDLAGRRVATDDPDTGTSASTYDANGNQLTTETPADGTIKTVYDNQDRPTKRFKVVSGNPTDCADTGTPVDCERIAKWTYDTATRGDGRLATSTSYTQLGTYISAPTSYDRNGNVLGETYTYPDNIAGTTPSGTITLTNNYAYNDADMPTAANYGAIGNLTATSVATTYGTNAQVDTMVATQAGQPDVTLLDATYDKVGRPLRALSTTGNAARQLNREYAWENATGRLSRVGGSAFGTLDYSYDLIGNPTSITAHNVYSDSPEDPTAAWCYTYEPLNRLKTAKTGASASNNCATPATNTSLIGANQDLTYYHSADRMVGITSYYNGVGTNSFYNYSNGTPHQTSSITGGTTSDPNLPPGGTLTYDTAGRIITLTPTGGPSTTSTYNPTGTLKTSTQSGTGGIATSYAYDTGGMRVARRDTVTGPGGYANSVRYFGSSELTVKTPAGGTTVTNGRRIFTTPGGKPLAIQAGNGTVAAPTTPIWTLQLGDGQDSLRFTRNQSAGIDSRPTYRPFGQAIAVSSNGERGFLNKPQDPNGDVRLDQRNYQPQLNVLTAPDLLLMPDDPQTLNPYAYSRNNPVSSSDPSGLECLPCEYGQSSGTPIPYDTSGNFEIPLEGPLADAGTVKTYMPVAANPKAQTAWGFAAELAGTVDTAWNFGPRTSQYSNIDLEGETESFAASIGQPVDGIHGLLGRVYFNFGMLAIPGGGVAGGAGRAPRAIEAGLSLLRLASRGEGAAPRALGVGPWGSKVLQVRAKVPSGWGPGVPNRRGVGTRWNLPKEGVRVDMGNPQSTLPSQRVDHVVVRDGGRILGPDGKAVTGSLSENPQAHIPLTDWLNWSSWNKP